MTQGKRNIIIDIICGILLLLFFYSAISKFYDHERFQYILSRTILLKHFPNIASWVIPITEIILSTLLFRPVTRQKGLYGSLFLLSTFTLFLVYMLLFSRGDMPCSCGGVISKMTWQQHIVFNIFFIALSIAGIYLNKTNLTFGKRTPP